MTTNSPNLLLSVDMNNPYGEMEERSFCCQNDAPLPAFRKIYKKIVRYYHNIVYICSRITNNTNKEENHHINMNHIRLFLIVLLCALAGTASAETVTYTFSGNIDGNGNMNFQLFVGDSGTPVASTTWSYLTATSASITDTSRGITLSFGTDKTNQGMYYQNALVINANANSSTGAYLTLSHDSKYIYHVTIINAAGQAIDEAWNMEKSYTYNAHKIIAKTIVVEYAAAIPITDAEINVNANYAIYYPVSISSHPSISTIRWHGKSLTSGKDYIRTRTGLEEPGTVTITVTGKGIFDPNTSIVKTYTWRYAQYTVHFDKNNDDATGTMDDQTLYVTYSATQNLTTNTFSRTGYILDHWNTKADDTGTSYADGAEVSNLTTTDGATVTLYAQWASAGMIDTYYVDENGTQHDVTATVLTGGGVTELTGGTYVVISNITYTDAITLTGDVIIILGDGKTMTVNSGSNGIEGQLNNSQYPYSLTVCGEGSLSITVSRNGDYGSAICNLSSYTQMSGSVTLRSPSDCINVNSGSVTISGGSLIATAAYTQDGMGFGINAGDITISGGTVSATGYDLGIDGNTVSITGGSVTAKAESSNNYDIAGGNGVSITGGQVTAETNGIYGNSITLGYTAATDFIKAKCFVGTVGVQSGQALYDDADNIYDENTPSSVLQALRDVKLTPMLDYTVVFDANGGTGDAMANQLFTRDVAQNLMANTYTRTNYIYSGWNTAADGSGTNYDDKQEVSNLSTPNTTVTLYAQWKKDIDKWCTAEVPGQTLEGSYIYYKFENANYGNAATGAVVKDGDKVLAVGTDYTFGQVYFYGTTNVCTETENKVGDHFTIEINGIGDYAGTKTTDFYIVSPSGSGTWGSLAWSIDESGNFSITGSGAMKEPEEKDPDNPDKPDTEYPWLSKANGIQTITIGEGITTVAAKAFGGTQNVNDYGNVYSITLPSTLTTIGEEAFAYCTGLTFNADNLIAQGVTVGENAFNQVGCIQGTLYDNADNTNMLSLMANAATAKVTIKGRMLYKNGNWNTICLPFNVSKYDDLLDGATVRELDLFGYYNAEGEYHAYDATNFRRTGFDAESGALYLYFKDATADSNDNLLKAGVPYLIKWPSGGAVTSDLTFNDVKVISDPSVYTSEDRNVRFLGTFSPMTLTGGDKSCLYLGSGSTLYWPSNDMTINAFRAYFDLGSNQARSFVLNFGDEETGIVSTTDFTDDTDRAGAWYSLDGRKLDGQPTKKGLYIHGGRMVVIK